MAHHGDQYFVSGSWSSFSRVGHLIDGGAYCITRRPKAPNQSEATLQDLYKTFGYNSKDSTPYDRPKTWDNAYSLVPVGEKRTTEMQYFSDGKWMECTINDTSGQIESSYATFRRKRNILNDP